MFYALFLTLIFVNPMFQPAYLNITDDFSLTQFEAIIDYALNHGDRKTYCNRYNNNPHLKVGDFDLFLSPTDKQNTLCDTTISGFNEIVIYHPREDIQYYHIKLVDAMEVKHYIDTSGRQLESNQVYLYGVYNEDLNLMREVLTKKYLPLLKDAHLKP